MSSLNKTDALQMPDGSYRFSLSSYEPLKVVLPKQTVTKPEVDRQLEELAYRTADTKTIEPRQARLGDIVILKLETHKGEVAVDQLTGENFGLELGVGAIAQNFEDAVCKLSPGESTTVTHLTQGLGEVTSKIELQEIRERIIPAINDIWVAKHFEDVKTVPDLADKIEKEMVQYLREEALRQAPIKVADDLAERLEQRVPQELLEKGYKDFRANFEAMLQMQGLTREQFMRMQGVSEEELAEQEKEEAKRAVEQSCALGALADHNKTEIKDEEIAQYLGINSEAQDQFLEAIKKDGSYAEAKESARRNKAMHDFTEASEIVFEGNEA